MCKVRLSVHELLFNLMDSYPVKYVGMLYMVAVVGKCHDGVEFAGHFASLTVTPLHLPYLRQASAFIGHLQTRSIFS